MGKHNAAFYKGHRIEPCRSMANRLHFHFGIADRDLRIAQQMNCFGYSSLGIAWPATIEEAKARIDVRMTELAQKAG